MNNILQKPIKQIHVMPSVDEFETPHGDIESCWCEPTLIYVDSGNGNEVWLHKELH